MHYFHVSGMKCGGCLGSVTRAIKILDSEALIEADLQARTIKVTSDRAEASLLLALSEAGYPATLLSPSTE